MKRTLLVTIIGAAVTLSAFGVAQEVLAFFSDSERSAGEVNLCCVGPGSSTTLFDLSETVGSESVSKADVSVSQATITDAVISGTLAGTVDFTSFEIVTVQTGPFAGKGFATGNWNAGIGDAAYEGTWGAAAFFVPADGLVHFRGSMSGEIVGTMQGTLSPLSGQINWTWTPNRIGTVLVTVSLQVQGNL